MQSELLQKKCVPCRGGESPLDSEQIKQYMKEVGEGWDVDENGSKIVHEFAFDDFAHAMKFVNNVADIAEKEGHHPDIHIHYNKVKLVLWTHKINGLHENDFILAAKINNIKL